MSRRKRQAFQQKRRTKLHQRSARNPRALVDWLIPAGGLFPRSELHGNIKWDPKQSAIQAVIWACKEARRVLIAFDGSRSTAARTQSNERAFFAPD